MIARRQWLQTVLRTWVIPLCLPGGVLLGLTALTLGLGLIPLGAPPLRDFYALVAYALAFAAALRFRSAQAMFAGAVLLLSSFALVSVDKYNAQGTALVSLLAVFTPLTLIAVTLAAERGLHLDALAPRIGLLFVESVFIAVLLRAEALRYAHLLQRPLLSESWFAWTRLPQLGLLSFALALALFAARFVLRRRPLDAALLWAVVAAFIALQGPSNSQAAVYLSSAGLALALSLFETSYLLAYHDELTGLKARRAFNQELLALGEQYAIAVVDVDHFKRFNDTYGHDVGDQVLRMVAAQLGHVRGGGKAFRCGGEEFMIVFPGKIAQQAYIDVEELRHTIEQSRFFVRGPQRRRSRRGTPDRRKTHVQPRRGMAAVSVTVSISVASPTASAREPEQVVKAADKALYRAKEGGRNRVEIAGRKSRAVAESR